MRDTELAQRALGAEGLRVSAPGLGCVGISELYGPRELDESRATLRRALELGVDFFDTADVVAYSPLGRGLLARSVTSPIAPVARDVRALLPRFSAENLGRNLALVDALAERAAVHGLSPAQLAIAWLLASGPNVVPIPGTKRRRYLEENVAAAAATLTQEEVAAIRAAIPRNAVAGARYADEELARVGL